jgi:hypothetical protein
MASSDRKPWAPAIWQIVLLAFVVRLAAQALIPVTWYSIDMRSWITVARILDAGGNPYKETTFLNWGPAWMGCLFLLSKIPGVSLVVAVRGLLLVADTVLVAQLAFLLRRLDASARWQLALLAGYAVNPVPVVLNTQHLNFDVLFLIPLLGSVHGLMRFQDLRREPDLLLGVALLGLAVLVKTPALVFFFLFLLCLKTCSWPTRIATCWLALAPVAIGVGVLYVLAPAEVTKHVLKYNSMTPFYFGLAPWTIQLGLERVHSLVFAAGGLALLALHARRLWSAASWPADAAATYGMSIYLYVILFGTGFGPQYLLWIWAFLPLIFVAGAKADRVASIALAAAGAVLVPLLYAMHPYLGGGGFLAASDAPTDATRLAWSTALAHAKAVEPALFGVLFAVMLGLFIAVILRLLRSART